MTIWANNFRLRALLNREKNASLIPIQVNECFVLKRKSKILGFLPQNHLPGGNFIQGILVRILKD
jgi:hypothetical protein